MSSAGATESLRLHPLIGGSKFMRDFCYLRFRIWTSRQQIFARRSPSDIYWHLKCKERERRGQGDEEWGQRERGRDMKRKGGIAGQRGIERVQGVHIFFCQGGQINQIDNCFSSTSTPKWVFAVNCSVRLDFGHQVSVCLCVCVCVSVCVFVCVCVHASMGHG